MPRIRTQKFKDATRREFDAMYAPEPEADPTPEPPDVPDVVRSSDETAARWVPSLITTIHVDTSGRVVMPVVDSSKMLKSWVRDAAILKDPIDGVEFRVERVTPPRRRVARRAGAGKRTT